MPKITLKRVTNTDGTAVELYPTTTLDQIISEGTGANNTDESLSAYLSSTYVPQSQKGAASGVATLDSDSKLTASQIPDYLLGGLNFEGALTSTNADTEAELATLLDTVYQARGEDNLDAMVGSYWVANGTITQNISMQGEEAGSTGRWWAAESNANMEEGQGATADNITLEAGDWLVIQGVSGSGTQQSPYTVDFVVVNNTYKTSGTNTYGIVRLTGAQNAGIYNSSTNQDGVQNGINDVVTESFLANTIASGEFNGGASGANNVLNKIASSNHIHDGRYYTETEIGTFFAGTSSISGYNKANWDAAYNDKVNSAAFATGTGVLTLTQQDGGTVTVDLDGRYVEDINSDGGISITQNGQQFDIGHADTSSIGNVSNSNGNVIQSATFDTYGHILTQTSVDLDGRYYTETEFNNWLDGTAIDGHNFTEIKYGASPSSTVVGTILIDVDA
jgi:hypothetical protein